MSTITFFLPKELKKIFKIKVLQKEKDMTEVLVSLIKKYIEE